MEGGVVSGGGVALRGTGRIDGYGLVQSGILAAVDATVTIAATGALEIGRDDNGGDVLIHGTLDVGAHDLTVHDPNSAVLGDVTLAGGQLHLPPGGGVIELNQELVGEGTITGPLLNSGRITSVGTGGLRFGGMVSGPGLGLDGEHYVFLDGGGYEGNGFILGRIQADPGSLIRASGIFMMGAEVADALILQGRIECEPNTSMYFSNSSPTPIEGELVLDSAYVVPNSNGSLVVQTGGRLQGTGTVALHLTVAGTVAPGNSAGVLHVSRAVDFDSGILEVELGDHAAGEWDVLDVRDAAQLAGTLDLRRLPTYHAAPGDSFEVVRCDSVIGTFANVTLDGAPLAGELEVRYGPDRVWVVVPSVVGVGDPSPGVAPVLALQLAPLASPGRNAGVELALPALATVSVSVYDIHGRQVGALWDGGLSAGRHRFDLARVPGAGVFFVRAVVDDASGRAVKKTRVVRLH